MNAIDKDIFFVKEFYIPKNSELDSSAINTVIDYELIHNLGGTLILLGPTDKYYSYLSERWIVNHEKKEIIFILRDDIKFSNGKLITTDDVAFTFKRLLITGATHLALNALLEGADKIKSTNDYIEGIQIIDKRKIKFKFTKISSLILYLMSLPDSSIISKDQVDPKTLKIKDWKITSGAYFVSDHTKDYMEFTANPYFIFHCKEIISKIRIVPIPSIEKTIEGLITEKIHFSTDRNFTCSSHYSKLSESGVVDIIFRNYGGTQDIILNRNISPFNIRKNRQAIYKHLKRSNLDLRPVKDDRYFVDANHMFLPTNLGKPKDDEINKVINSFPDKLNTKTKYFFNATFLPGIIDKEYVEKIISKLNDFDFEIKIISINDLEEYKRIKAKLPFVFSAMFLNEKEIHQAIEYMDKMGRTFAENRDEIMTLNRELAGIEDKKKKRDILVKIGKLITEDALVIPLYYIIHQDFINHNYEIIDTNNFEPILKLWKIRKKKNLQE